MQNVLGKPPKTYNKCVNTDRTKLRRFALHLCAPGYAKRYA